MMADSNSILQGKYGSTSIPQGIYNEYSRLQITYINI